MTIAGGDGDHRVHPAEPQRDDELTTSYLEDLKVRAPKMPTALASCGIPRAAFNLNNHSPRIYV